MKKAVGLSLFVLVSLAGMTPFALQAWGDYRAYNVYVEGQCTVLSRGSYATAGSRASGDTRPAPIRKHPELEYKVNAAGAAYFTFGFDNMKGWMSDINEAYEFEVGRTYPCWYDPADPEKAILKRQVRPKFYLGALIPGFMLLISGSMLAGALRGERKREPSREIEMTAETRARVGLVLLLAYSIAALGGAWLIIKYKDDAWFLALLLVASVIGLVKRFIRFWRVRHLADPSAVLDEPVEEEE